MPRDRAQDQVDVETIEDLAAIALENGWKVLILSKADVAKTARDSQNVLNGAGLHVVVSI